MFKWLFLLVGLAVGASGGMYYGVHHPKEAGKLSDAELKQVLNETQTLKDKLATVMNKQQSGGLHLPGAVSNLIGGNASSPTATAPDPDLKEANDHAQSTLDLLKSKLTGN